MNSIDSKQIRKFGWIAFIFFGCLCAAGIWAQKPIPIYFFGSLSALGLGFILFPNPLRPLFVAWLKVAHVIGIIITTLALSLAYYFVITPAAFLKRIFGGAPRPTKPDKELSSYWVTRDQAAQPIEQFSKRF